ncbi:uncharacterized protein [Euwallacea fornicatus]|uniref:uncharacterized protein n=1 Tax=Euwallacea fornicatus TaxID=995702 RepID=UPI00338D3A2C
MGRRHVTAFFFVIYVSYAASQLPQRFQVPGALPIGTRPAPLRTQSISPARLRRPTPTLSSGREVRPVIEDIEEPNYPSISPSPTSAFDEEVNKLGLSLQSIAREDEEERQTPLPFRPERPVPIIRDQIRDKPLLSRPSAPPPLPTRAVIRQDIRDDPVPLRQTPVRQQVSRPAPVQTFRAAPTKIPPRQQTYEDEEDERDRRRKPVSQILRKYRTDNEDGSITWGFENDDGTFKEETLGADCIIRGKYGYVDPDGVKREFSYETGNKCDEPELEEEEELLPRKPNIPQSKGKPLPYRPQPQYVN